MQETLQRILINTHGRKVIYNPTNLIDEMATWRNDEISDFFMKLYTSLEKCSRCHKYYYNSEMESFGDNALCSSCYID